MKTYPSEDLPGNYAECAETIAERTGGDAVVVLVLGGERGNGACPLIKLNGQLPVGQIKALLVAALRAMAAGLEGTPLPIIAEAEINARTPKGAAN